MEARDLVWNMNHIDGWMDGRNIPKLRYALNVSNTRNGRIP
jgi:hypothetical protein